MDMFHDMIVYCPNVDGCRAPKMRLVVTASWHLALSLVISFFLSDTEGKDY
jgi:hypothetical protein